MDTEKFLRDLLVPSIRWEDFTVYNSRYVFWDRNTSDRIIILQDVYISNLGIHLKKDDVCKFDWISDPTHEFAAILRMQRNGETSDHRPTNEVEIH